MAGIQPDMPNDIARDIGKQVETMILNAKQQSETKVGQEMAKVRARMESMKEKIHALNERVGKIDLPHDSLLKADLAKSIAKLEEVWEGEVGTLKHELWQTIQAHNHNADLMKHHKDAIEQIQVRLNENQSSPELEQLQGQLSQVDRLVQREIAKQQQMDQFVQRFAMVQQQLAPGMAAFAGMNPYAGVGMAGAMASMAQPGPKPKTKNQKNTKQRPQQQTQQQQASALPASTQMLRADAAEFVPTWGAPDASG